MSKATSSDQLRLGSIVFSEFRVRGVLATGGQGIVYSGKDGTGQAVVIKVARTDGPDEQAVNRLRREVMILSEVVSPHVIKVRRAGLDPSYGVYCLVEDLAPGVELGMVIEREEKLVLTDVLEILHQTAKGLEAIHFAGYLMRDLTPSQILVWRAESGLGVRIVDLGLARSIGHGSDLTDPEVVAGTPGYLAPELVYGINPTIAADVYSLAVVAFHLFSGQLPHHGIKGAATVAMQLAMEPPRLVPLLPLSKRCCRALDELFSRALDSDPTRRPSSPLHFVRELTDCCNRFSTSWWRRWFA